jgi:hypothetical protein
MGRRPTQGDEKRLRFRNHVPWRSPSPLSSRAKPRDLQFRGPLLEMCYLVLATNLSSRPERTRISCHTALDEPARAPFVKERRMMFANATNFYRKSGVA